MKTRVILATLCFFWMLLQGLKMIKSLSNLLLISNIPL